VAGVEKGKEMAVADTKKVQRLMNRVADEISAMRAGMKRITELRDKYVAQNVDAKSTPLEGNVTVLTTALTNLGKALDSNVFTQLIAAKVPSHRGVALGE